MEESLERNITLEMNKLTTMKVIYDQCSNLDILILTPTDFNLSDAETGLPTAHKGHKFDIVILPKLFEDTFTASFLFKYLRGSMCIAHTIKAKLVYY
jgi:hypothetical protein